MSRNLAILLALAWLAGAPAADEPAEVVRTVAEVSYEPAAEISGMVKSATYPGVYWVHNDSDNQPRLFALDAKGAPILPVWLVDEYAKSEKVWPGLELLVAANVDWEDLTLAEGRIYLADMGNNGNARRDLGVYVINEPNPRATDKIRPLKFLPIRYPDQKRYPARLWHFDCEAVFWSDGKLYFITKHRAPGQIRRFERGAKLYRLDTSFVDRENVLTLVESRADLTLATAAETSPDGKLLAVLTYFDLWVFSKPAKGDHWLSSPARRLALPQKETQQAEAVCWKDSTTLRIANEQRKIFEISLAALQPVKPK